jgi:hypothetical protein
VCKSERVQPATELGSELPGAGGGTAWRTYISGFRLIFATEKRDTSLDAHRALIEMCSQSSRSFLTSFNRVSGSGIRDESHWTRWQTILASSMVTWNFNPTRTSESAKKIENLGLSPTIQITVFFAPHAARFETGKRLKRSSIEAAINDRALEPRLKPCVARGSSPCFGPPLTVCGRIFPLSV